MPTIVAISLDHVKDSRCRAAFESRIFGTRYERGDGIFLGPKKGLNPQPHVSGEDQAQLEFMVLAGMGK